MVCSVKKTQFIALLNSQKLLALVAGKVPLCLMNLLRRETFLSTREILTSNAHGTPLEANNMQKSGTTFRKQSSGLNSYDGNEQQRGSGLQIGISFIGGTMGPRQIS
ncbi:hypothetical protein OIU84_021926 [Salix udensis]|uniref:Uncharacterized protein n=1 Tax=Salix udensis TaxID=889485 RepID=A0AAD6PHL2_9ROSI|nr:hypothetical protein OIU84_021926 [Salix udensis]